MMYLVKTEWSGYSRGKAEYEVEATSKEDALIDYHYGLVHEQMIRDDREDEVVSVEEIK